MRQARRAAAPSRWRRRSAVTETPSDLTRQHKAAVCVRIYIDESDTWHGRPLGPAVMSRLLELGCSGATLFRGAAGFGARGQVHTGTLVDVSPSLPLVVEWIDSEEGTDRVLAAVLPMVPESLVVRFSVVVVQATRRTLPPMPGGTRVATVMTRDVVTARPDTPLRELVAKLIDQERRSVVVTDEQRHVAGIVTNSDLIERGGVTTRVHFLSAMGSDAIRRELDALGHDQRTAADVMTRRVVTVEPTASIRQAAHLMASRHLKRLPVVDHGHLVGIVSRADLLRSLVPHTADGAAGRRSATPAGARVGDVLIRDVPLVRQDAPLPDVLDVVIATRLGRAVVVDAQRRPVGVISGAAMLAKIDAAAHANIVASIVRRLPFGQHEPPTLEVRRLASATRADELMTAPVDTVTEATPVADAAALMLAHRRKILPVVDEAGALTGMVDRAGLLRALHTTDTPGAPGDATDLPDA